MNPQDVLQALAVVFQESMDGLSNALERFVEQNKKSLEINRTLDTVLNQTNESLKNVKLSIDSKFAVGLELQRQSILGNNEGLAKLAATQAALGLKSTETIRAFREVAVVGMMSNVSMNNLAKSTLDSALRYGVSTEILVEALDELTQSTQNVALAGGDPGRFLGAVQEVIGRLGGERNVDNVTRFANMLLDTSLANQQRLVTLGIKNIQDLILAGGLSQKQQAQLLVEAMQTASRSVSNFAGTTALNVEQQKVLFGKEVPSLVRSLAKEIETLKVPEQDPTKTFDKVMNNLENVLSSFFAPLQSVGMQLASAMIDTAIPAINLLAAILETVVVPPLKFFAEVAQMVGTFLYDTLSPAVDFFTSIMRSAADSLYGAFNTLKEVLGFIVTLYLVQQAYAFLVNLNLNLTSINLQFFRASLQAGYSGLVSLAGALFRTVWGTIQFGIGLLTASFPLTILVGVVFALISILGGEDGFFGGLKKIGNYLSNILTNIFKSLGFVIQVLYQGVLTALIVQMNVFMIVLDGVLYGLLYLGKAAASLFGSNSMSTWFDNQLNIVERRISGRVNNITDQFGKMSDNISDGFEKLKSSSEETAANTRKPVEIPKFLEQTDANLREAVRFILGLTPTNVQLQVSMNGQLISMNDNLQNLQGTTQAVADATQTTAQQTQAIAVNTRQSQALRTPQNRNAG